MEEEKEKEDTVVQLAAVVCMKDEIAIHSMTCVLHKYIVFVFHCSNYPIHTSVPVDTYKRFHAIVFVLQCFCVLSK